MRKQKFAFALFGVAFILGTAGIAQQPAAPTEASEKSAVLQPTVEVSLIERTQVIPTFPTIVGDTLYFSELTETGGQNIWKYPLGAQEGFRGQERVLEVAGILSLETDGTQLYVHTRNENRDTYRMLRIAPVAEGGAASLVPAFQNILGPASEEVRPVLPARLAHVADTNNFSADALSARRQWVQPSTDRIFSMIEIGRGAERRFFFDAFVPTTGRPVTSAITMLQGGPQESDPLRDGSTDLVTASIVVGNRLFIALDGVSAGDFARMGKILSIPFTRDTGVIDSANALVFQGTNPTALNWRALPDVATQAATNFAVRQPRYFTGGRFGFVGMDTTPITSDLKNVFYYSISERRFHRILHLSRNPNGVSGLSFTRGGLLVSDGVSRVVRWYGATSPFLAAFNVRRMDAPIP